MKAKIVFILCLCSVFVQAQIGILTTAPEAALDVKSTNGGILIPRVALTSLTVQAPVVNPQGGTIPTSTLVFHNGTNAIAAGYYYWDGAKWMGVGKEDESKGLQYYVFSGNGASPTIEKSTLNLTLISSGIWNGALNDAAQDAVYAGNNFVIFFTGTFVVKNAGNFQIQSVSDDGSKVIIDTIPVLNRWNDQGVTATNGNSVYLSKGKHKVEFWYYDNSGSDFMEFNWLQNANGTAPGTVNANDFIIE